MPNNIFLLLLVILLSKFCRSDTHLMYLVSLAHSQSDTQMGPLDLALVMVLPFLANCSLVRKVGALEVRRQRAQNRAKLRQILLTH